MATMRDADRRDENGDMREGDMFAFDYCTRLRLMT